MDIQIRGLLREGEGRTCSFLGFFGFFFNLFYFMFFGARIPPPSSRAVHGPTRTRTMKALFGDVSGNLFGRDLWGLGGFFFPQEMVTMGLQVGCVFKYL